MTIDQMLYVASRINDWNKAPFEIARRAIDIIHDCEMAANAYDAVEEMKERGLSPLDVVKKAMEQTLGVSMSEDL